MELNKLQKVDMKSAKKLKKILEEKRNIQISYRYAKCLVRNSSK